MNDNVNVLLNRVFPVIGIDVFDYFSMKFCLFPRFRDRYSNGVLQEPKAEGGDCYRDLQALSFDFLKVVRRDVV